jgi:hypothetical protein
VIECAVVVVVPTSDSACERGGNVARLLAGFHYAYRARAPERLTTGRIGPQVDAVECQNRHILITLRGVISSWIWAGVSPIELHKLERRLWLL